ncbi:hypothetical protein VOLCADRAFT_103263 [Volvox carteri f. nagariensis]|uniref:ABC1 atypical kinase-like domain-containing protein n=1 Tax=Volvox carteri f. nagariensis TaxID=3068 RepID=D8TKV3_VOLCA|nr:uncharacterized protein VOLCADRAFT_103263 [Volvox carteri f. nagariensis]EFJ51760.1 hypothetical protein VOLCADRAFT_103263 [Volvox carteri f. nagariensis]|eukprot:XP_002947170.1 hypothetical protein VOLCADRAFT_103263 [Volvox carteri f. nagariensis]
MRPNPYSMHEYRTERLPKLKESNPTFRHDLKDTFKLVFNEPLWHRGPQVISQSPGEADPTLALPSEHLPGGQPAAQVLVGNQPQPEPHPAQQQAVAEPEQGPHPPRPAPDAINGDPDIPLLSSSDSDSGSGADSDWLSDLEAEDFGADRAEFQRLRAGGGARAQRNQAPAQVQQEGLEEQPPPQPPQRLQQEQQHPQGRQAAEEGVRYMALLRGHSEFAHSSAGSYPLYRGAYVYGFPYAPYGGSVSPSVMLPRGAAAAAADATALARRVHALAVVAVRRLYFLVVTSALVAGAAAVASATDTATSLAAAAPRTLRTVMWAIRASLSYKRFQASCYGADTEHDEAYQAALSQLHTYWAKQLLAVCRRNGGVYVKAGQFAAAFGGVPREYRTVLSQLEDRAVPNPYKVVRRALERELGGPERVDSVFSSFSRRATAAASLAQVHKAVLADGREVAVKVQYPGLASSVAADLATMKALAAAASALFPDIRLAWLYEELAAKLEVELDFRNEIRNSRRFQSVLRDAGEGGRVVVPELHEGLCSSKVLIMEWIEGAKITDVEALQRQGINPRLVGRQLVKLFGELMFIHGYVHGDPHPGNLMVRPKGRPNFLRWLFRGTRRDFEIVVLDHGTYLEMASCNISWDSSSQLAVAPELRQQFCQLWCAAVMHDEATQADISTDMAGERGGRVLPLLLTQRARNRAEERALRERIGVRTLGDMTSLLSTVSRHLVDLLRVVTVMMLVGLSLWSAGSSVVGRVLGTVVALLEEALFS